MRQLIRENNAFKGVVETAAQQLVNVRHFPEGSFVTTPMSYPSGAQVVIRVEPSGSDFFVSEFGVGFQEAEMIGGERIYKNLTTESFLRSSFLRINYRGRSPLSQTVRSRRCSRPRSR
jgi:hypothetical protein